MHPTALIYNELLGSLDDAIALAEDAIKEASKPAQQDIKLVKVANERYETAADTIVKSGAFPGITRGDLTKTLRGCDTNGLLNLMEKMASAAVFPMHGGDTLRGGDFVEKATSAGSTVNQKSNKVDRWRTALDEAEVELM